jgi:hypothetical protein
MANPAENSTRFRRLQTADSRSLLRSLFLDLFDPSGRGGTVLALEF